MSLLNVSVSPKRVVLSVDTQTDVATSPSAPPHKINASKILALPHAHLVVACRGDQLLLNAVMAAAHASPQELSLVELAASLADAANHWADALPAQRPGWQFSSTEFVSAGWSRTDGRMRAFWTHRLQGEDQFTTQPLDTWLVSPGFDWKHPPQIPDDAPACASLARKQVARHRAEQPGVAIGGFLLYAEVTRNGTSIRTIADLERK